jgi:hypothetical protein
MRKQKEIYTEDLLLAELGSCMYANDIFTTFHRRDRQLYREIPARYNLNLRSSRVEQFIILVEQRELGVEPEDYEALAAELR